MADHEAGREILEHHRPGLEVRIREAAVQLAMVLGWTAAILAGLGLVAVAGMAALFAFGLRPHQPRPDSTRTDAQSVRSAAVMYLSESPDRECPRMKRLLGGGYLDTSRRNTDAWDRPFEITCAGDDIE